MRMEDGMTPESQTMMDRLEAFERENRSLRALATVALVLAAAALIGLFVVPQMIGPAAPGHLAAQGGVVEGTKFLLRDPGGRLRGGMEVDRHGAIKLVLGNQDGQTGAAMLVAQPNGVCQLTMHGPDGGVRAAL